MSAPLSARIRAGSEAAPWVVAEVRKLEEVRAAEAARHQQELSDERIGRLFAEGRIATLRATVAADDERLRAAGARVGVEYGCDTADWMAERILELRATADQQQARIRELENEIQRKGYDHDVVDAPSYLEACARITELEAALKQVTDGMDRAGGDRDGMPECPWCRFGTSADPIEGYSHDAGCELVAARQALETP